MSSGPSRWDHLSGSTATRTTLTQTASSSTILALNANRVGAILYVVSTMPSTQFVYVGLGASTVTTADFTMKLANGDTFTLDGDFYGVVKARMTNGVDTCTLYITEYTA